MHDVLMPIDTVMFPAGSTTSVRFRRMSNKDRKAKTHDGESRTECRKVEYHHHLIELLREEENPAAVTMT